MLSSRAGLRFLNQAHAATCNLRSSSKTQRTATWDFAPWLTTGVHPSSLRYHKIPYSPEAIDRLLADVYLESHAAPPHEIVLDLDATDIPLYGHQPERFLHGYYDSYCYLPLYIFADGQVLCARLRPANQDASQGSLEEVERIVAQFRQRWPEVKIVLRADSGFCREQLMAWCESHQADYVFGLARNQRLGKIIGVQMQQARAQHQSTGKAVRVFTEFSYRTRKSWSCQRRVVAKAEYRDKGENPRFVVPSLTAQQWAAPQLYEKFYCARGEMENRIKEQMGLFAGRLSTDEMKGNQLPILLRPRLHAEGSAAQAGTEGQRMGPGAGRYHPPQAVQDRRHRAGECAPRAARTQFGLSLERHLRPRSPRPALLKAGPNSANLLSPPSKLLNAPSYMYPNPSRRRKPGAVPLTTTATARYRDQKIATQSSATLRPSRNRSPVRNAG